MMTEYNNALPAGNVLSRLTYDAIFETHSDGDKDTLIIGSVQCCINIVCAMLQEAVDALTETEVGDAQYRAAMTRDINHLAGDYAKLRDAEDAGTLYIYFQRD
jgi:hypothetical protein